MTEENLDKSTRGSINKQHFPGDKTAMSGNLKYLCLPKDIQCKIMPKCYELKFNKN